jgi:hypothetical protein
MIGLSIAKLLKADSTLMGLVPAANIFPYVANENTQLPLIVYQIDGINVDYTKDGWAGDDVEFSVISFSEDYASLQAIVLAVRKALEMNTDTNTDRITVTKFQEGFNISENVFMNKLSFKVGIDTYY